MKRKNYIFVLYYYKSSHILFIPIKNRQAKSIADAWKLCYIRIKNKVHAQDLNILDNECSNLLKSSFNKNNINFQKYRPTLTVATPPNRLYKPGKNTSSPDLPHVTQTPPQQNGTASCHSVIWQSTYFDRLAFNQTFHPTPASLGTTTSTEIFSPPPRGSK